MIESNMGEFESQINYFNSVENFWLKARVSGITHDLSLI
jgi:hypothetical protein